jgi:hypothetical protein
MEKQQSSIDETGRKQDSNGAKVGQQIGHRSRGNAYSAPTVHFLSLGSGESDAFLAILWYNDFRTNFARSKFYPAEYVHGIQANAGAATLYEPAAPSRQR